MLVINGMQMMVITASGSVYQFTRVQNGWRAESGLITRTLAGNLQLPADEPVHFRALSVREKLAADRTDLGMPVPDGELPPAGMHLEVYARGEFVCATNTVLRAEVLTSIKS